MLKSLKRTIPADRISSIEQKVTDAANAGDQDAAWDSLQPLLRVQRYQRDAARSLLRIVRGGHLQIERGLDVLVQIDDAHSNNEDLLAEIGCALEGARDIDDLNSAPPDHPFFDDIVSRLSTRAAEARGLETEERLLDGLSTATRMLARQRDDVAEKSYKRLIELDPACSGYHYGLGLFYKTRGRFLEGLFANEKAASLQNEPKEAYEWNRGICATGAREGVVGLEIWKRMGQKIEMGRFGLPEGGYPQCKVRLAQRPLAERTADTDDPGLEETIWMERLSPCHGIVRSVLYQDLGVDYGDVVLIDGAPITYHTYGETRIPVFPHLATLVRNSYQFFDFAGTQDTAGRLKACSEDLERDTVVYSHTESFQILCANCWRDPDLDHEEHEQMEKHVARGRIAAPPDIAPSELLRQLDQAVLIREPCKIYSPSLCHAAGQSDRANVERRRLDMLVGN
jgi:tetratricopeptide (TPR) repeat protein